MKQMPAARRFNSNRGFTLLEVLVAITIFAVITALLFSGFQMISRSWRRGAARIEKGEKLRSVFSLARRQIISIYPVVPKEEEDPGQEPAEEGRPVVSNLPYFVGTASRMAFISLFSLRLSAIPGLCFVSYSIESSEEGPGLALVEYEKMYTGINPMGKEESEPLPENIYRYVLFDNLQSISFRFYGLDYSQIGSVPVEELQKQWYDSWDVETMGDLPEAVEIEYAFLPREAARFPEGKIVVPIRSHGTILRRVIPRRLTQ